MTHKIRKSVIAAYQLDHMGIMDTLVESLNRHVRNLERYLTDGERTITPIGFEVKSEYERDRSSHTEIRFRDSVYRVYFLFKVEGEGDNVRRLVSSLDIDEYRGAVSPITPAMVGILLTYLREISFEEIMTHRDILAL